MKTIYDKRYLLFVDKVKARRKELGWGQADVARRLHVPRTWVGKVERRERRVDLVEAWDMCKAYGIPFSDLEAILD